MPFKINFSMTWLSWLSHCIAFQIPVRKKKQRIEKLWAMLSFVWNFLFYQSKNNAVLGPRTGHCRGLVGFEANAKNLSFEAKDLENVSLRTSSKPRTSSRTQPLVFTVYCAVLMYKYHRNTFGKHSNLLTIKHNFFFAIPWRSFAKLTTAYFLHWQRLLLRYEKEHRYFSPNPNPKPNPNSNDNLKNKRENEHSLFALLIFFKGFA